MFIFGFTIGLLIEKIGNEIEKYNLFVGSVAQVSMTCAALFVLYYIDTTLALELQSTFAGLFFVSALFNTQSYFQDLVKYI